MPVDPRIPAFKRYDILLAIDGDRNNVALKRGVLAPEVKLLQALHARFGDSDAGNPVELAPGDDGLPAVEEARIAPDKAYAYLTGVYGAPLVEKLFGPKLNRNLPFELDVDDYELAFAQAAKDDAAALAADPDPLAGAHAVEA